MTASGDEDTSMLAPEPALLPQPASSIPERLRDACIFNDGFTPHLDRITHLPLSREVTVTSGDTQDEGVEIGKVAGGKDGIIGLGGRIHLGQDFLREGLLNPGLDQSVIREVITAGNKPPILVDGGRTTSGLDALLLGLSHCGRK